MKFKDWQARTVSRAYASGTFEELLDKVRAVEDSQMILMQFNQWLYRTTLGVNTAGHLTGCEMCRREHAAWKRILLEEAFSLTPEMWQILLEVTP